MPISIQNHRANAISPLDQRQRRGMIMVIAYPFVVGAVASIINLVFFDIPAFSPSSPSFDNLTSFILAAVLLTINHSWIMTATEITRIKYNMYATPEEWAANDRKKEDAVPEGLTELERVHNTHRNTTENMVYFVALSLGLLFLPKALGIDIWLLGFALARLGYTYSYLYGKDGARGLFMTLSLLSMYGMAGYLVISLSI